MWVPVYSEAAKLVLTASLLSRSPPLYLPSVPSRSILDGVLFLASCSLFFLVVSFTGRCGHVRLPPGHGLPGAPTGERTRAAVRGRHEDLGTGLVPAVLGLTALAAAHADVVVPWGAVAGAERVWGVLPAEAPGERGGKGAGARSAPGVDRMPGERGGGDENRLCLDVGQSEQPLLTWTEGMAARVRDEQAWAYD